MDRKDKQASKLRSHWVTVNGQSVHVRVGTTEYKRGKLPDVVLVHGLIVSSLYMVPSAKILSSYLPVYSPDLPGFGLSDNPSGILDVPQLADSLLACIDALELDQPALVGHSFGCQIIADFSVRYPNRISCAVLSSPTMDPHARNRMIQFGRWLWDWPGEKPSLVLVQLLNLYEAGIKRAYRTFRYALEDHIEEKLPGISVPTLVMCGVKDPVAPQRWCEEAVRLLPHGKLGIISGGPHVANYTVPEQFARMILNFIRRLNGK